jgi:organic hydroperoxide reductase OsmC/OhrA
MATENFYQVNVDWTTERKGRINSPVLSYTIEVATPPEFPKGIPDIWSPEHLLFGALNSCLMTTFPDVADNSKLEFKAFHCKAIGKLETVDSKWMISEITLAPLVSISDEHDREKTEKVLAKSEAKA